MMLSEKPSWLDDGGAATFASLLYAAIFQPWSKEAKARRAEKKMLKLFMRGSPEVKGFFDAVVSGPERVQLLEGKVTVLEDTYAKIKRGNELAIAETKRVHREVKKLREMWTVNDNNTNRPGEVQMRQAKASGVWLDHPEDSTDT